MESQVTSNNESIWYAAIKKVIIHDGGKIILLRIQYKNSFSELGEHNL